MAFRRSYRKFRSRFSGGTSKVKKQLSRAKRYASNNKKKAATMTTIVMALGAYVAYDKFIKK
ncbi:hypothetical protein B0I27_109103 [Arcticibacter pallidicorallinus]|uniref:Uncharacterized protein n=1 Tax=Arcticibacter pallidicorallinus TaxID=1259464 RepID=A0A2T0TXK8_9SPHI|nr:hypothetical protein [Arcticibacter pallidicorallinus]PRY50380.1 hypothetical protein B0I27_109103 [Arcticibacter pallidicorallinus]